MSADFFAAPWPEFIGDSGRCGYCNDWVAPDEMIEVTAREKLVCCPKCFIPCSRCGHPVGRHAPQLDIWVCAFCLCEAADTVIAPEHDHIALPQGRQSHCTVCSGKIDYDPDKDSDPEPTALCTPCWRVERDMRSDVLLKRLEGARTDAKRESLRRLLMFNLRRNRMARPRWAYA